MWIQKLQKYVQNIFLSAILRELKNSDFPCNNNIFCLFSHFSDPIFDVISTFDHADCGKLLVCHVVAKNENELTAEEKLLAILFNNFMGKVNPNHSEAQYILAAKFGAEKEPKVCAKQYYKCPYHPDKLSSLLKKQWQEQYG